VVLVMEWDEESVLELEKASAEGWVQEWVQESAAA
jgi:hypothetical protein